MGQLIPLEKDGNSTRKSLDPLSCGSEHCTLMSMPTVKSKNTEMDQEKEL